jgi:hypothetical protein
VELLVAATVDNPKRRLAAIRSAGRVNAFTFIVSESFVCANRQGAQTNESSDFVITASARLIPRSCCQGTLNCCAFSRLHSHCSTETATECTSKEDRVTLVISGTHLGVRNSPTKILL